MFFQAFNLIVTIGYDNLMTKKCQNSDPNLGGKQNYLIYFY